MPVVLHIFVSSELESSHGVLEPPKSYKQYCEPWMDFEEIEAL